MDKEFKPGKSYTIMTLHKFQGEFKEFIREDGEIVAVFKTGGAGRYGEHTRKVPVRNIFSSELTKNGS